jgi:hypothetical protein
MVRFRVIHGGKKETKAKGSRSGIYRAISVGDLTRDRIVYHDVKFNWYCLERRDPRQMTANPDAVAKEVSDDPGRMLEKDAGRCFTEEEVSSLDAYLWDRYGMSVSREEVVLPLATEGLIFEKTNSVIYDFLDLSEKEGYPLPFKVWGYYSLQDVLTSDVLENGVRFLRRALKALDWKVAVTHAQLETLVKTIHDEEGLVVRNRTWHQ